MANRFEENSLNIKKEWVKLASYDLIRGSLSFHRSSLSKRGMNVEATWVRVREERIVSSCQDATMLLEIGSQVGERLMARLILEFV